AIEPLMARGDTLSFFFSSRRRHTRSYGDWSSDVCSSDLRFVKVSLERVGPEKFNRQPGRTNERPENPAQLAAEKQIATQPCKKRSEERRVGKECRSRWSREPRKKKTDRRTAG